MRVERAGDNAPGGTPREMVFDLICRSCGACQQRHWDPTDAVSATPCPRCEAAMSVIGIDFPRGRTEVGLSGVLELIQGAGIKPLAVERRARGFIASQAG